MRLIRSWPAAVPAGRAHVVDTLPRFVMSTYTYEGLVDLQDDVIVLEWDMAVTFEQLQRFVDLAREDTSSVITAPYRIYQDTYLDASFPPVWAQRRYNPGEQSMRWINEDDTHTHMFPLGLTYLPRDLIAAFVATGHRFGDIEFSGWHYRNVTPEVPITWDVLPVHLHYDLTRIEGVNGSV